VIYCVEDDESIRAIELYTLKNTGFEAEGLADGAALTAALGRALPELILLDVMLPGESGTEILRRLRADPATAALPVIMATARGAEYDKIRSLDLGADDYLVKPFGMMEMVSRVRAVLRRSAPKQPKQESGMLSCGGITMNLGEHSVQADGVATTLTLKEFELLRLLLTHPGTVFTRDQLLSRVWDMDYDGETRTVDVHIRTLRQKLGSAGEQIGTVRGVGYRLEEGKQ
jgi:two-component system alkaline phosphatase synthesis response regulator PhoP